jgi:site-specific recombinase XerD
VKTYHYDDAVPVAVRTATDEAITEALRGARHLRSKRVVSDHSGMPLTQRAVQGLVKRAAERANVKPGVHILRHTFCSHLAMRGAAPTSIQKLAGHQDLSTTQRYMHLTPAALSAAIRLLEMGTEPVSGEILETRLRAAKHPSFIEEFGCGGGI